MRFHAEMSGSVLLDGGMGVHHGTAGLRGMYNCFREALASKIV